MGVHVRGQRDMPTCPGIRMEPVFGMVFQAGMEHLTRITKQEKKTGGRVIQFVAVFTSFLPEHEECMKVSPRERSNAGNRKEYIP